MKKLQAKHCEGCAYLVNPKGGSHCCLFGKPAIAIYSHCINTDSKNKDIKNERNSR